MKLVIREKNEHTLQVNLKDITSNLIGIWHFEQDTKDESGYNNHAILNGGEFINAKIGYGIQLDGIDDHLTIGNKYNFANREPFTISFWIKPNTIKNGWMRIFSKEEYNNGRQGWLIFQDPDGRIGFERWRDDIGGGVLSNKIIDTKEFTHIACIYDGNKISIYINGELDNYSYNSIEMINNNAQLFIGAASYYSDYFNGIIDEVRIYNRALTDKEVRDVYESRSISHINKNNLLLQRCRVYIDDLSLDNLIGIWHFEQDTKDESGYNNHAILNGGEFINAKIGYGIQLDGIDDHLTIGNKYNFANREPFTISFWIKPNTIKNGWMRIFSKEEYNNGRQGWLIFQDPDGRIGFERWRDDIGGGVLSNKIIDTKEFTHIACIYDGNKISIYINGELDNYSYNSIEMINNNAQLFIGAASYYSDYFNGIIDEVRIYNRALTDKEVRDVYESRSRSIKIFEGLIIEVNEIGEFNKTINIIARDLFKDRLLTRVINKKYIDTKASDIFKDIVKELGSEFTLNGVEDVNIIVSEDFPYFQAQLACDTLAEDTSCEYFCKPNLDCVFRQLKVDDSNITITEDMIKSPAEVKRSYAESISEVIVVGGLDENNNRVIARAINKSLPEPLLGRKYVLHDKRYTDYTSAKLRALSILNTLSKMFTIIDPIFVKDIKELPFPGQLVTLHMPTYGFEYTKVLVKQIEINAIPGNNVTWLKLFLGEKEENLEDKIVTQQQIFEKERVLGTTFNDVATQQLANTNEQIVYADNNKIRRCKGFYLDYVPNNIPEALEFGLDGRYASQLDL